MSKIKNIVIAAASLVIFSNITHAQALKASYSVSATDPLKVVFLSDEGETLLFKVTLNSKFATPALFSVYDQSEGQLFSGLLPVNTTERTVRIEKREGQILDFQLILGKKIYSKTFSSRTSIVETTTVSKIDITKL